MIAKATLAALAATLAIGPGAAHVTRSVGGYRVELAVTPNLGGLRQNTFVVGCTRNGKPVDAAVTARFDMVAMPMPALHLVLRRAAPGRYRGVGRMLTMPGTWQIDVHVAPRGGKPFDVLLVDHAVIRPPS
jgi:hypothetical protein